MVTQTPHAVPVPAIESRYDASGDDEPPGGNAERDPFGVTITDAEAVGIIRLCCDAWELRDCDCTATRIVLAWWSERAR